MIIQIITIQPPPNPHPLIIPLYHPPIMSLLFYRSCCAITTLYLFDPSNNQSGESLPCPFLSVVVLLTHLPFKVNLHTVTSLVLRTGYHTDTRKSGYRHGIKNRKVFVPFEIKVTKWVWYKINPTGVRSKRPANFCYISASGWWAIRNSSRTPVWEERTDTGAAAATPLLSTTHVSRDIDSPANNGIGTRTAFRCLVLN